MPGHPTPDVVAVADHEGDRRGDSGGTGARDSMFLVTKLNLMRRSRKWWQRQRHRPVATLSAGRGGARHAGRGGGHGVRGPPRAEAAAVAAGVDPDVAARVVRWHPTVQFYGIRRDPRARAVLATGHAPGRLRRPTDGKDGRRPRGGSGPSRGATPRFLPGPARCPGRPPTRRSPCTASGASGEAGTGRSWERRRQK